MNLSFEEGEGDAEVLGGLTVAKGAPERPTLASLGLEKRPKDASLGEAFLSVGRKRHLLPGRLSSRLFPAPTPV